MTLIVTKKEMNLLIGSNIINDYPLLQEFIVNTPNLTTDKLTNLNKKIQLFFNDIYPKVISEVIKEWMVDRGSVEYVESNDVSCELCGHKPIKNICVIENSFTKKRLKIGTECVEHFGIGKDIDLKALTKEAKRIKILENLNSIFPGIEIKTDNWESLIERQDILIKSTIKDRYMNIGKRIKELFNSYCDDKTTTFERSNIISEMKSLLKEGNNEKINIEKYIDQIRNNPLAPKKVLFREMSEQYKETAIKMIEEDGLIKGRTLWRINNLEFSNSLIEGFNKELHNFNCQIEKSYTYKGEIGYFIVYQKMKKYKLFCRYSDFCTDCYSMITGEISEIKINLDLLISISKIIDEVSLERAAYYMFKIVKVSGFSIYNTDYANEEIVIKNNSLNLYYILNIINFVNAFKTELIRGRNKFGEEVLKYISKNLNKPFSKSDIDYLLDIRNKKYI